ncbi:MAG: hypothetical protein HZB42_15910 [Sphingobacteriales bacterium]|nr:hypothetical protein [Sphingobacteriales bacterium]
MQILMQSPSRQDRPGWFFILYLTMQMRSMRTVFYVILILLCASCGNKSAISKKLSGCDSLVITFNAPNSDSIINMVSTAEKKAINKLSGFLNGKAAEQYKCGYDGNMIFYKKGQQVMPVVFKYSEDGCRHFLFDMDNKLTSIRMSNEAADFLESLSTGKAWY